MKRRNLSLTLLFLTLGVFVYCANIKWKAPQRALYAGQAVSKSNSEPLRENGNPVRKQEVYNKVSSQNSGAIDHALIASFLNFVSMSNSSEISEGELRTWLVNEDFDFTETSSGMTDTGVRILFDSIRPNRGIMNFRSQAAGNDEASLKLEGIWFAVSAGENSFASLKGLLSSSLRSDLWKPVDLGGRNEFFIWRNIWNADLTLSVHDKERPTRWESDSETLQLAIQPSSGHY